ncbi:hypothetical protein MUA04_07205 [Enterobacteriaceae bacterium H11S18]|uniref:DUF6945 domain-containing protein n=1 Tax=Dryocola clanedunensis TaxID=2925396 RepID=UPI0022F05128|nr:hypothetical protein [Dryocola clanedunensis]MCT4709972.1 hypothetical protein [Dryocola clanedunensis]
MPEKTETKVIKEPSLIVPKRLTAHKIVVKSTGEVIEITNDHRIIYGHLEDQFRSLTNPKNIAAGRSNGHYYDSDENLAIRNGVSKYTFKKVKKDLKTLGLIDWKTPKAKKSGHACEYFVKHLLDVDHTLELIYRELPNGQPSYNYDRVSGQKTKNKKAAKPTNEARKNDGKSDQDNIGKPSGVPPVDAPVDVDLSGSNDSLMGADAVNGAERWETPQRADIDDLMCWREEGASGFGFMEYGEEHGETDVDRIAALIDQHYLDALNQITIFDEKGVVTESFINSAAHPRIDRNDDGSVRNYSYAYARAKTAQAYRDGTASPQDISNSWSIWFDAALPRHIPAHLLPEPEF